MTLRLLSLMAVVLITLSCTTKKEVLKPITPPPPIVQTEQKIVLPDVSAEPSLRPKPTRKAKKTKPVFTGANVLTETTDEDNYIILNFEKTDIRTIIETFGELLNINYILTPGISGSVTIQSYNKFPSKNLFQIFLSILEINGLTITKDGDFYRVIQLDLAKQQPMDIVKGQELELRLDSTIITQLIPLQYVKSTEIANILRTLMPRGTNIIIYEPTNMLIVTALPSTLIKFMKIIEALDVQETENETIRTFVYQVEHGKAKKLAEILQTVYPQSKGGATIKPRTTTTPARITARRRTTAIARATRTANITTAASGSLPGEIGDLIITAYEDINALIIKSTPKTYLALLEVLKKIDVPQKQVMIEVLVAEVSLDDETGMGLQWDIKYASNIDVASRFSVGNPSSFTGLFSGVIDKLSITAKLTALAGESRLNVLASPQILVLDNQEAEIKIGEDVPTATSSSAQLTTDLNSVQIEYRSVGTILKVTPQITDKGNVSMKLSVESSTTQEEGETVGGEQFPVFLSRKINTSAVVASGETLFIGGLISDTLGTSRAGLPYIRNIPLLGYLFSTTEVNINKKELIFMVTPYVISNQHEANVLSRDYQDRVRIMQYTIEEETGLDSRIAVEAEDKINPPPPPEPLKQNRFLPR